MYPLAMLLPFQISRRHTLPGFLPFVMCCLLLAFDFGGDKIGRPENRTMMLFCLLVLFISLSQPSPINLKYAGTAVLLLSGRPTSSFITPKRNYVFSSSTPSSDTPTAFHLFDSPPSPPIDDAESIITLLSQAKEEFLYVKSSTKVLNILGDMSGGPDEFHLTDDRIIKLQQHLLSVMSRQKGEDWHVSLDGPAFLPSSLRLLNGKPHVSSAFHQDGSIGKRMGKDAFLLNVWIATRDVTGYPLAFVRSGSLSDGGERMIGELRYDPAYDYVYVPDMKAGESLIFKGSDVFHGSPTIRGTDGTPFGEREAIFQRFLFTPK
jgi:hypothetical protein